MDSTAASVRNRLPVTRSMGYGLSEMENDIKKAATCYQKAMMLRSRAPNAPPPPKVVVSLGDNGQEDSTDAYSHFFDGERAVRMGRGGEAVIAFQRALASIPDYLGITPWFQSYLVKDAKQMSYGKRFVARIYGSLAEVLFEQGRREDALFAVDAALRLDDSGDRARRLKAQINAKAASPVPSHPHGDPDASGGWHCQESASAPPCDTLTLLMVTHFTGKLNTHAHLSPPGTGLVSTTHGSLEMLSNPPLAWCRKVLCYDRQYPGDLQEAAYARNLEEFAESQDFELKIFHAKGLLAVMTEALGTMTTPYVMFMEHDWRFQRRVPLARILSLFDRDPSINYVKFNKRENAVAGWDFLLEQETRNTGMPLIRAMSFSNNPFIARVGPLRHRWLPLCLNDTICRTHDLSGTSFGVEHSLFKHQLADVRKLGFTSAHARWGTYIYGRIGDPAAVVHLGE